MPALADLADQPFELLKALEARARAVAADHRTGLGADDEWVGLGFRIGELKLVAAREEIRELMPYPGSHRLPQSKDWLLGVANVRGQLLPITDLKAFLNGSATSISRSSRVLAVDHAEIPAGLLVDEVYGFRRFHDSDGGDFETGSLPAVAQWLRGGWRRGEEAWGIIDLRALIESPAFLQAAR
ncbi:MAG TPA: chemotaxis protein CheW [Gammaproteobacteria bacterium]|nr:chemotaxis protein CheW [Gammaproteobacteria bacterium]